MLNSVNEHCFDIPHPSRIQSPNTPPPLPPPNLNLTPKDYIGLIELASAGWNLQDCTCKTEDTLNSISPFVGLLLLGQCEHQAVMLMAYHLV